MAGVGLVGDLCRNLSQNIVPYTENLVRILIANLTVSLERLLYNCDALLVSLAASESFNTPLHQTTCTLCTG